MSDAHVFQLVLWHPEGQLVAVQDGSLPVLELDARDNLADVGRKRYGLAVWTLHDGGRNMGLKPPGFLRLQALDHRLAPELSWGHAEIPALHHAQPWQCPGWPTRAQELLLRAGLSGELTQVFTFDLNTVLQVETATGPAFLKVSHSPGEMQVTALLSRLQPALLPPLFAVNEQEHWQISASGGELLDGVAELEAWTQALERLAKFQTQVQVSAKELGELGCPAYPLVEMKEQVDRLIRDTKTLLAWDLGPERINILQAARPRIATAFAELKALNTAFIKSLVNGFLNN